MSTPIRKFMGRKQLAEACGIGLKKLNKQLHLYFKHEFDGIRLFSPAQVDRIADAFQNYVPVKES